MSKARDIASAALAPSTVSATELGYVDGVTSAIQTQLDAKTAKSTLTTTGDIYYASAANTPARLGIGSTDQVLKVTAGIPAWATPAGGGKVLQVVNATYSTVALTTSSTYSDTGLTATITPTSATSKILVTVHQTGLYRGAGNSQSRIGIRLLRASTTLITLENHAGYTNTDFRQLVGGTGCTYLDSPATTSATTYKTQFANLNNAGDVYVNFDPVTSTMTLMEIGA